MEENLKFGKFSKIQKNTATGNILQGFPQRMRLDRRLLVIYDSTSTTVNLLLTFLNHSISHEKTIFKTKDLI